MNQKILLNKLKLYGVCQASLNWFALYLTNRTEKTFIDGVLSDSCIIKCGIAQGSILGQLLLVFVQMIFHLVTSTLKCRCMQMIVASMLHILMSTY